jgi:hypothetical protein
MAPLLFQRLFCLKCLFGFRGTFRLGVTLLTSRPQVDIFDILVMRTLEESLLRPREP